MTMQQSTTQAIDKRVYIVAHYFMKKSRDEKRGDFTNKKLQKLLFYAQAWSLVLRKKKLFDAKFKAWVHGAAIPDVYRTYSKYGFKPIDEEINEAEFEQLSSEEKEVLDSVWNVYGKYDGDYLEILNHEEEPWQRARAGMPDGMRSDADIDEKIMREYYDKKLRDARRISNAYQGSKES